jgi:hypothetical protein
MGAHFAFFLGPQIECSSISDYAVKIVKANKLDHGERGEWCVGME